MSEHSEDGCGARYHSTITETLICAWEEAVPDLGAKALDLVQDIHNSVTWLQDLAYYYDNLQEAGV